MPEMLLKWSKALAGAVMSHVDVSKDTHLSVREMLCKSCKVTKERKQWKL